MFSATVLDQTAARLVLPGPSRAVWLLLLGTQKHYLSPATSQMQSHQVLACFAAQASVNLATETALVRIVLPSGADNDTSGTESHAAAIKLLADKLAQV